MRLSTIGHKKEIISKNRYKLKCLFNVQEIIQKSQSNQNLNLQVLNDLDYLGLLSKFLP